MDRTFSLHVWYHARTSIDQVGTLLGPPDRYGACDKSSLTAAMLP